MKRKNKSPSHNKKNCDCGFASKPDPRLVEIVKLLARSAAKKEYNKIISHKKESLIEEFCHE